MTLLGWAATVAAHADAGHGGSPKAPRAPTLTLDDMIRHDAATWEMGISTDREVGDYGNSWLVDQQPRHEVETDAFYLDETEVTVREFALFLTYSAGELHYHPDQPIDPVKFGYLPEPETGDEPIRQVTWRAARDYCEWAGKRLPTEAEWEFAATGTERRTYPWGDDGGGCDYANYFLGRSWCADGPVAVDTHPQGDTPNGVADMGGNVAEWVSDWYGEYPNQKVTDPTGPESGDYKVIRGGGFIASGQFLRSQARRAAEPVRRAEDVGFRCAADGDIDPSTVNGHLRGTLSLPPDTERETEPRFPGEPVPRPDRVATGLDAPSDMTVQGGNFYVIESGADTISEIDPDSGETSVILEDQAGMQAITSSGDRLYVTVRNGEMPDRGKVLELVPGMPPITIASGQTNPGPVVANSERVVWGTESAVISYDTGSNDPTAAPIVTDLAPVRSLELMNESQLAYGAANLDDAEGGKTSEFKVGVYDFSEGTDQEIFPGDNSGNLWIVFYPSSLTFDESTSKLWMTFNQPGFPRHGYLCGVSFGIGSSECLATHTPPRPEGLISPDSDTVFWTSQRSIVTYRRNGTAMWMGPSTYDITSTWSAPRGLLAHDGELYWLDNRTGRLLRTSF